MGFAENLGHNFLLNDWLPFDHCGLCVLTWFVAVLLFLPSVLSFLFPFHSFVRFTKKKKKTKKKEGRKRKENVNRWKSYFLQEKKAVCEVLPGWISLSLSILSFVHRTLDLGIEALPSWIISNTKNVCGVVEESTKRMSTDENPTFCKKNRLFVKSCLGGFPCLCPSLALSIGHWILELKLWKTGCLWSPAWVDFLVFVLP